MTSSIFVRMTHAKDLEPIHFTGNQIKSLELKRLIVDLKNLNKGMDFDFKINDENSHAGISFILLFKLIIRL